MRSWYLLAVFTAAVAAVALPKPAADHYVVKRATARSEAIKEAFIHSWNGYREHAWGFDELLSVSNKGGNSRNGWGASIADALSTAILMELEDVVLEQLEFLETVDFTTTESEVSLFETTIRYLGGLISGYDLLTGPYSYLVPEDKIFLVDALLAQAVSLADRLAFAFDTPVGIPYNNLDFSSDSSRDTTNGLATTGTLVLEWTRLSDLTGNNTYAFLAQRAEGFLLNPSSEAFPGLPGSSIDIATGKFTNLSGGWGGGTDSFYEYLLKMWIYSPGRFGKYKTRWIAAAESTISHLLQTSKNATFVAGYNGASRLSQSQGHLTCFIGGNFLLGGQLLGRPDIKSAGEALTKGCRASYAATASGLGPEVWSWSASAVPVAHKNFYNTNGFYPTASYYDLRPEVVESYYHGWKLTGREEYRDWAWEAFQAMNRSCRTESAYSRVMDVMATDGGQKGDFMESFWFAEVLKYLWITFTSNSEVGVAKGRNAWVFNTEAHPFKVYE